MLGEAALGQDDGAHHLPQSGQVPAHPGIGQGRGRDHRGHAPALGQAGQRRPQVGAQASEGGIEQDRVEAPRRRQQVADQGRVVAAPGRGREQAVQQGGAVGRQLVQGQAGAAGLGHPRQQAGPGGGLQHPIARAHLGRQGDQGRHRRRGRELVERHLRLAPPAVGEAEGRHRLQQGRDLRRGVLKPAHLRRQPAHLQHGGGLDRVIGVPPHPCAFRVGAAEGQGQGLGHQPPVEAPPPRQVRGHGAAGGEDVGGTVGGAATVLVGEQGKGHRRLRRRGRRAAPSPSPRARLARPFLLPGPAPAHETPAPAEAGAGGFAASAGGTRPRTAAKLRRAPAARHRLRPAIGAPRSRGARAANRSQAARGSAAAAAAAGGSSGSASSAAQDK